MDAAAHPSPIPPSLSQPQVSQASPHKLPLHGLKQLAVIVLGRGKAAGPMKATQAGWGFGCMCIRIHSTPPFLVVPPPGVVAYTTGAADPLCLMPSIRETISCLSKLCPVPV